MGHIWVQTTKTSSKLWLLTYETTNYQKQNIEGGANNKLLDEEDTQRSNLNSKYLSLILVLDILILWFFFIVPYTCKVRFEQFLRSSPFL